MPRWYHRYVSYAWYVRCCVLHQPQHCYCVTVTVRFAPKWRAAVPFPAGPAAGAVRLTAVVVPGMHRFRLLNIPFVCRNSQHLNEHLVLLLIDHGIRRTTTNNNSTDSGTAVSSADVYRVLVVRPWILDTGGRFIGNSWRNNTTTYLWYSARHTLYTYYCTAVLHNNRLKIYMRMLLFL